MFISWSPLFETNIELVDKEHKALFQMLNDLTAQMSRGGLSEDALSATLDQFLEYAEMHFSHEEELMLEHNVFQDHVKRQRMEHSAFKYDLNRVYNSSSETAIEDRFERLIQFATSWLVFHTLRTDQLMGIQVQAIKQGATPEAAFEQANNEKPKPAITRMVMEAVIHLWTEQAERCQILEAELEGLRAKSS